MIDTSPDTWGQIGALLGVLVAGAYAGWQSRQTKHVATEAKEQAQLAAENAHPISNGWGTALRADMAATRMTVERIAESQLLAERRELARAAHLDRIAQRLDDHITEHRETRA